MDRKGLKLKWLNDTQDELMNNHIPSPTIAASVVPEIFRIVNAFGF